MTKVNRFVWVVIVLTALFSAEAGAAPMGKRPPGPPPGDVLALAQEKESGAWAYVQQQGASIEAVGPGTSFAVWWQPENFDPKTGIVFVSLHGHAGWATRDFEVWHKIMKQRGFAYAGIQWWYGRSMESEGYAKPDMIYRWIREVLEKHGAAPGRVIFLGFSMGSANSYPVAVRDRASGNPYFAVSIADAGPMEKDFPPVAEMFAGRFGTKPLEGSSWILYCSMKDQPNHACGPMGQTKEWLEGFGARVPLFLQDPVGDHGGFMKAPNYSQALDLAEKIVNDSPG